MAGIKNHIWMKFLLLPNHKIKYSRMTTYLTAKWRQFSPVCPGFGSWVSLPTCVGLLFTCAGCLFVCRLSLGSPLLCWITKRKNQTFKCYLTQSYHHCQPIIEKKIFAFYKIIKNLLTTIIIFRDLGPFDILIF